MLIAISGILCKYSRIMRAQKYQRNSALDATRRRRAHEQETLIDQMCRETELSPSALAKEAGFRNPTITRPLQLGRPIKFETMAIVINTYEKIMSNKGLVPTENVLRYDPRYSAVDDMLMTDPTPDRLKLAVNTVNEDFNLGMSDDDIQDLCNHVIDLYRVIVDLENKTGVTIPNDAHGRATLRRALFARHQLSARTSNQD
jgi:hypothetical protein